MTTDTDNTTPEAGNTSLVKKEQEALTALKRAARGEETVFLLVDTSSSMFAHVVGKDEKGEETRKRAIDIVREVVATVRGDGDLPIIAFGGPTECEVRFVDVVPEPDGSTPLHAAIKLAKEYGATRLVVISDGVPDLKETSLENARAFGGQIDVVYIGAEGSGGSVFLNALASATGGKRLQGDLKDPRLLTSHVIAFLDGEVEAPTIIQGDGFTAAPPAEEVEDIEDDCPTCDMPDGEHADDCPNREDDEEDTDEDDEDDEDDEE